jgi:ADP-heptose:LPS heptosyltransferase
MPSLESQHPAVFFCNALGDHLLALPALRALAEIFRGNLTLVCKLGAAEMFFSELKLARVCEVPMTQPYPQRTWVFDADALASELRPCDLLLSLNCWHSRSVDLLLRRLSPARSVGFSRAFRRFIPVDWTKHTADRAFEVPRLLCPSLRLEEFSSPPALPAPVRRWARRLRATVPPSLRVLAVHADTKAEKRWPTRRWVALLDRLLSRHRDLVVFDVGLDDLGLDQGAHHDRIVPCCGLPLGHAMALLSEADMFLGVDSCMLHAADLFRVPGVGLFGTTEPHEFGFRFGPHRHVVSDGRMAGIGVAAVARALGSLASSNAR